MRPLRPLAVALPLILLAPVGVVEAAAATEGTTLTIAGAPKRGIYHDDVGPAGARDAVQHQGRLTTDGEPVAEATVLVGRKLVGGSWEHVETTTDADGHYVVTTAIEGNARYQASYAGDLLTSSAESSVVRLRAMRDFNAELVRKKRKAVLEGDLNPGWEQRAVHWERRKCKRCRWVPVDRQKSGDDGSWRFEAGYPPVGKRWVYRAWIRGTDEFVKSYSSRLVTTSTPARRAVAR